MFRVDVIRKRRNMNAAGRMPGTLRRKKWLPAYWSAKTLKHMQRGITTMTFFWQSHMECLVVWLIQHIGPDFFLVKRFVLRSTTVELCYLKNATCNDATKWFCTQSFCLWAFEATRSFHRFCHMSEMTGEVTFKILSLKRRGRLLPRYWDPGRVALVRHAARHNNSTRLKFGFFKATGQITSLTGQRKFVHELPSAALNACLCRVVYGTTLRKDNFRCVW